MAGGKGGGVDGDLRALVVKLRTAAGDAYAGALLAGGATASQGSYTIRDDVLFPGDRPTVALDVYADADDNVLASEVVQAVYRGPSETLTDDLGHVYGRFPFYVLVGLEVPREGGGVVTCFAWAADPEAAGLAPPYDSGAGKQGFDFAAGFTADPV